MLAESIVQLSVQPFVICNTEPSKNLRKGIIRMRKGKGRITNGQYRQLYQLSQRENARLRQRLSKLQNDYNSIKAAHNKMLKDKETLDGMPNVKRVLQMTDGVLGATGMFF